MKRKHFYPLFFKIILLLVLSTFSYNTVNSLTLYKWTDENGVVHYSDKEPDKKAEILRLPEREKNNFQEDIVIEQEAIIEDDEQQRREEAIEEEIRSYWRNLALGIEQKKERILEEIFITEKKIEILTRNIDYYLLNGYKADFMILDLRYLEERLPALYQRLEQVELEKKQLRQDARKQGIPPGYLRP